MLKEKIVKTPIHSRPKLIKNLSCGGYDSKKANKIIFKIKDRLFSSNTLSILSKNNFNLSRNIKNILHNQTPNNIKLVQIKNYHLKSFKEHNYKTIYSHNPQTKASKITYTTFEETKAKKPKRQSILEIINKRGCQFFFPEVASSMNPELEIPRKFTQINKILKFNITKKKEELKKELVPMQLGKEYHEFIEKRNKLKFNPNFNSPYIHKMNSNYFIDNNFLNKLKEGFETTKIKARLKLNAQMELENKQLEEELRDKIEEMSLDLQNYKKAIKLILTDETKLNQIYINEEFFSSFVNKVNYLFDDRKFPTIKNKLGKLVIEVKATGGYQWNRLNMIEISTLTYLHKLKAKVQRELDEIGDENKEKQFKINQEIGKYDYDNSLKRKKKNVNKIKTEESKSTINNNNQNNSKTIENFLCEEEEEEEKEEKDKTKENKEDLYEFEEFFVNKGRPYKRIDFAIGKLAYTVYHNPKFYIDYSKNKFSKKEKNIIKTKKEFDLYL